MTKIGIIGCGIMGTGIAQLIAQTGMDVVLYNRNIGTYEAKKKLFKTFDMLAAKGKIADVEAVKNHVLTADSLAELVDCAIVIEAISEDFNAKVELLKQLEDIIPADHVIASNTSSFSITALSAGLKHPNRVAGLHFFNPVPLMKIVEIVKSSFTDENTIVDLTTFVNLLGHKSILTKDTPGFVINHAGRGYVTEAMRVLTEGTAPFYEIDRILKDTAGFRMGPCELLDLTALDVSHPVMESIYEQFYHDPRYKPQPITRQMLAAGHVGRKAGKGFYTYVDGKQETFPEQEFEHIEEPLVFTSDAMIASMLHGMKCMFNNPNNNSNADVILTGPMGTDATTEAIGKFIDPTRAVAVDMIGDMSKRVVLMTNPKTTPRAIAAAVSAFKQFGRQVSVIRDSSGFVTQRVLATIINIACEIAQQGIASPADIDLAVKLGLGYPKGPLEWGNAIGAKQVLRILENLQQQTGDDRYRPCPWLRRRAQLGLSLLAQEQ